MDRFSTKRSCSRPSTSARPIAVVTLFTRGHGRLSAFGRRAPRNSKRRFGRHARGRTRPHGAAGHHPRRHAAARWGRRHPQLHRIRDDLTRIARAMYCLELCRETSRAIDSPTSRSSTRSRVPGPAGKQEGPALVEFKKIDALQYTGLVPARPLRAMRAGDRPRFDPDTAAWCAVALHLRVHAHRDIDESPPLVDLFQAYYDARKNKRMTESALRLNSILNHNSSRFMRISFREDMKYLRRPALW